MLITILIIISALYWLGIESKWFAIRLLVGIEGKPLTELEKNQLAYRINWVSKKTNSIVDWLEPICGWNWIAKNEHNLDNYKPSVELLYGSYRQTMTFNSYQPKILREVLRIHNKKFTKSIVS